MNLHHRLFAIALVFLLPATAYAIPIQYTYDSGTLTNRQGTLLPVAVSSLTGTFTVELPSAPTIGQADRGVLLDYMFTDGHTTFDQDSGYTASDLRFRIDALGMIDFTVLRFTRSATPSNPHERVIITPTIAYTAYRINNTFTYANGPSNVNPFTVQTDLSVAIPEPGTLALFAAGLLGVASRRVIGRHRA